MSNHHVPITKNQTIAQEIMEEESESDDSLSFTSCPIEEDSLFPPDKIPCRPIPQTYDWVKDLSQNNYDVAPVQCFRYVRIIEIITYKNNFEVIKNFVTRLPCLIVGMI